MNLPNKLTVFRVILIVPFVVLLLGGFQQWGWFTTLFSGILPYTDYIAVAIFIIASLTDLLDGKIARKYNLVTDFGKFMDPLADKLLVCSAMICLIEMGRLSAWIVIVIISREFIISGFRLVASDNGVVIAASYWGKFKTTFQMLMIIVLLLNFGGVFVLIGQILTWIALILTVVSLVDYIVKNKDVILKGVIYGKKRTDMRYHNITGYLWDDVQDLELIQYLDVLVDGRFVEELKDNSLPWKGSANQRVIDVQKTRELGQIVLYA